MERAKSKKIGLLSMAIFGVLIAVGCLTVSASSYTSTLNIGNGVSFSGSTRYYTAGTHKISIYVDSYTKMSLMNYTKLKIQLARDNGNSSTLLGTKTNTINDLTTTVLNNFGTQTAGNKYYSFSTKIDGTTYGGVKSNSVVMSS